jgi:dTDP-4-dehydrorhamnose 3,5-epimerase
MQIETTPIAGCLLITPKIHGDPRGYFKEIFQAERYRDAGITPDFVQDNFSHSRQGVLRGLHFQTTRPQGKLIQALNGVIYDVCVDLRADSPTLGEWYGASLTGDNHRQLYIPPGCAHGFYVASEKADVTYKCTDYYVPSDEETLMWNDPDVGIKWPLVGLPTISGKDQVGLSLQQLRDKKDLKS